MQKLEDDDWPMDETEIASRSIDMWQAKPVLYDTADTSDGKVMNVALLSAEFERKSTVYTCPHRPVTSFHRRGVRFH